MAAPTGFPALDAMRVTTLAPPAPLKQKPNLVTRAFASLLFENAASARGAHRVLLTTETNTNGQGNEPVRCRSADERTVVHVTRASRYNARGGALRLVSTALGAPAPAVLDRLASVSVLDGEVYLASPCEHAWLNGVALREKGGVKQARIAPNMTHRLRVLDSIGKITDLRVSAKSV